jgi:hypothetical protein
MKNLIFIIYMVQKILILRVQIFEIIQQLKLTVEHKSSGPQK